MNIHIYNNNNDNNNNDNNNNDNNNNIYIYNIRIVYIYNIVRMMFLFLNSFFYVSGWLVKGPWSLVFWNPKLPQIPRFQQRPGSRLLHEISCRLPHRSGDTTAGTLQLHWASKDAMLGPVEKGRKRGMVSAGGGEKKGCLKGGHPLSGVPVLTLPGLNWKMM
jgi:hypothetical protein